MLVKARMIESVHKGVRVVTVEHNTQENRGGH